MEMSLSSSPREHIQAVKPKSDPIIDSESRTVLGWAVVGDACLDYSEAYPSPSFLSLEYSQAELYAEGVRVEEERRSRIEADEVTGVPVDLLVAAGFGEVIEDLRGVRNVEQPTKYQQILEMFLEGDAKVLLEKVRGLYDTNEQARQALLKLNAKLKSRGLRIVRDPITLRAASAETAAKDE